jgi:hypothetical protein
MRIWSLYDVNYVLIFDIRHAAPDFLTLLDELCTCLMVYSISFMIFFWSNCEVFQDGKTITNGTAPLFLLFAYVLYESYEIFFKFANLSHGLFDSRVLRHFAFFWKQNPSFRDIFAADCLVSMTRVITDALYGSCWVVSGSFLVTNHDNTNFGGNGLSCTNQNFVLVTQCAQTLPMLLRLAQCVVQYKFCTEADQKRWIILNGCKYSLTIILVLFDAGRTPGDELSDAFYYLLKVLAVLYTFWWDIRKDWGLFDWSQVLYKRAPTLNRIRSGSIQEFSAINTPSTCSSSWLRQYLMFKDSWKYSCAIVFNFVFRSLWVLSLSGDSKGLVGPQLNFFLATMEIMRRFLWGMFKVENQHLQLIKQGALGFVAMRNRTEAELGSADRLVPNEENDPANMDSSTGISMVEAASENNKFLGESTGTQKL